MDEQEATDRLEELVGSVDKCFRLMRLYRSCEQTASTHRNATPADDRFRKVAQAEGYTLAAVNHYLDHVR